MTLTQRIAAGFEAVAGRLKALDAKAAATQADLDNEKLVMMGYNASITALGERITTLESATPATPTQTIPDTGWRNLAAAVKPHPAGSWVPTRDLLLLRRVGNMVSMYISRKDTVLASDWGGSAGELPAGFRPPTWAVYPMDAITRSGKYLINPNGTIVYKGEELTYVDLATSVVGWMTNEPFPTELPGAAWGGA